jgi:hypothetical protein
MHTREEMSVTTAQFRLSFFLLISLFGAAVYYSNSLLVVREKQNESQHRMISQDMEEKFNEIQSNLKGKLDASSVDEKIERLKKEIESQFAKFQDKLAKKSKDQEELTSEIESFKSDLKKAESLNKELNSKLTNFESEMKKNIKTAIEESEKKIHKIQPDPENKILSKVKEEKKTEEKLNSIKNLTNRFKLWTLLQEFNFTTMLEVGVYKGQLANATLSKWTSFDHYYGIDLSVSKNVTTESGEKDDQAEDEHDKTLTALVDTFGKKKITLMKNGEKNLTDAFKEQSIDFIYIDFTRHDYCAASGDIASYYPILKCGGLYAGHDFLSSSPDGHDWGVCANGTRVEGGVKRAVLDFAKSHSVKNVYTTLETEYRSWYFIKNC